MLPTLRTSSRVRIHSSSKRNAFWCTFWNMILMIFNTFMDVLYLAATSVSLKDPDTPIKGSSQSWYAKKRMVHKLINLNDVKLVKTAMNTVNLTLVPSMTSYMFGVTEAGLFHCLNIG
ncbi:hypothetical protein POM88_040181 [Heracleum sosnowskyi]|uniref:Uncharacterized protein n=1 Tax=Heracleum sosnowskyi TaxID=360622 RepID=A0AAD8M750_9APIA|nr:hypothetical protein POM88_040181 [Heracleum sosnowskyi]